MVHSRPNYYSSCPSRQEAPALPAAYKRQVTWKSPSTALYYCQCPLTWDKEQPYSHPAQSQTQLQESRGGSNERNKLLHHPADESQDDEGTNLIYALNSNTTKKKYRCSSDQWPSINYKRSYILLKQFDDSGGQFHIHPGANVLWGHPDPEKNWSSCE